MVSPGDRDWGKAEERENYRPFRGKRKLDNIGCFKSADFQFSSEYFPRGGELK